MIHSSIGSRLKNLRKKSLILTQERFADILGIDRSHVGNIEKDLRHPSDNLIKHISLRFGVSEAWLKTGEGEMFLAPEEDIKRLITCYGQQAVINGFINVMKECSLGIHSFEKVSGTVIDDPEYIQITRYLDRLWMTGDQRIRNWASVQFERAFPEIKEMTEDETLYENQPNYIAEKNNSLMAMEAKSVYLPLLGKAAAGKPIEAIEMINGYFPVPAEMAKGKTFLIKVSGDSMTGDGINDGDLVVIRAETDVEIGEIGLFKVDNDIALKRKKIIKDKLYLLSSNEKYEPIPVDNLTSFNIIGKYITHISKSIAQKELREMPVG